MKPEEISEQLIPILDGTIAGLKDLEALLIEQMGYYEKKHVNWLREDDFRPGTFSRILSSVVASKFTAEKIRSYLEDDGWPDDYREKYMPEPWKKIDYFGHLKEVALLIRFHLIHSIYSQIEATHRIIVRQKGLRTNTKPATAVHELTDTYPEDSTRFFDFIRNSIHNNGLHYPSNENFNVWTYSFMGKDFHFQVGEPIYIDIDDIIRIIRDQVEKMVLTLRHPEVENIEVTKDAN